MLQAELGTAADFLESYELVAFDVADPEGSANNIVAGAVHGGDHTPCAAISSVRPTQPVVPMKCCRSQQDCMLDAARLCCCTHTGDCMCKKIT
jgi:hypothetical protein